MKTHEELEQELDIIADKLQNKSVMRDHENAKFLIDEFLKLSDEQEKLKPYGFMKKRKKGAIKLMSNVIEEALKLKTKNRALYERKKNEVNIALENIAKRFKIGKKENKN